jgi:UDP-2,3-diacylglucosamine hydrolase
VKSATNIYFASDLHLGAPNAADSLVREKMMVKWLDKVAEDATEIYLLGDVFDFWFEYKHAIPKGYTRLLGKLSEVCDRGIPVHIFTGNHDMWIFDYLPKETGVVLHREPISREWDGKKFYIGHGDGLGPGDYGYKIIKKVFASKLCQWLFARIHPNLGIGIANFWSRRSRISSSEQDEVFLGNDEEWLVIYSKEILEKEYYDYFVFGHRHLPLDIELGSGSRYINTGDWIKHFTYGHFNGDKLTLEKAI